MAGRTCLPAKFESLGVGVTNNDCISMTAVVGSVILLASGPNRILAEVTYRTISRPSRGWYGISDMT